MTVRASGARPAPGTAAPATAAGQARLPWWAVALPALAFAVLLAVLAGAAPADAAARHSAPSVVQQVLERIERAVLG